MKLEDRTQAFRRITNGIRQFINHSVNAAKLILEAKRLEIWKEKYSSWQEYCEKEFGTSRQRVYQLLDVASTISEIESVKKPDEKDVKRFDSESGKNKEILHEMTSRQAAELKGLEPAEKASIFESAIAVEGGKPPKPETIAKIRSAKTGSAKAILPHPSPKDNSYAYIDEPRPPRPTQLDAEIIAEVRGYPLTRTFEVFNQEEDDVLMKCYEEVVSKRACTSSAISKITLKQTLKKNIANLIRELCQVYKAETGKTFQVCRRAGSAQLRSWIEDNGIEAKSELIDVLKKACVRRSFYCDKSHRLPSLIKFYGDIRHEIENPNSQRTVTGAAAKRGSVPDHSKGW